MYSTPIKLDRTSAEVMEESYTIDGFGTEVVWVTFPDGLTVSVARNEQSPGEVDVRGWKHEDEGPVFKKTLKLDS